MKSVRPTRVAIVTNIPAPYRTPLYNQLSRNPNIEICVFFLGISEGQRAWKNTLENATFNYEIVSGLHIYLRKFDLPLHLNPGILMHLTRFSPDVVVTSGYDNPGYWLAALYTKLFRKRLVLWFGSNFGSMRFQHGLLWRIKNLFLLMTDSFLSYGTDSAELLEKSGQDRNSISVGLNTVDMDAMKTRVAAIRSASDFATNRARYPKFMFLFSGQLIPRKRPDLLLDAFRQLDLDDTGLMFIGDGPMMDQLKSDSGLLNIPNVYYEGFVLFEQLPEYYALADTVVLPSDSEVWGLVINEALAAGAYAISSDVAGCSADLLSNPYYGAVFKSGDVNDLAKSMKTAYDISQKINEDRSDVSSRSSAEFGIHRYADALIKAVSKAIS